VSSRSPPSCIFQRPHQLCVPDSPTDCVFSDSRPAQLIDKLVTYIIMRTWGRRWHITKPNWRLSSWYFWPTCDLYEEAAQLLDSIFRQTLPTRAGILRWWSYAAYGFIELRTAVSICLRVRDLQSFSLTARRNRIWESFGVSEIITYVA